MNNVIARDKETGKIEVIRCHCGARVELDNHDTDCDRCGQPYNCFGQALTRGHGGECVCPDCC